MQFHSEKLAAINNMPFVLGFSLIDPYGELIESSINDEDVNGYILFVSGMNEPLMDKLGKGEIHKIMIRGTKDDSLIIFVSGDRTLGIQTETKSAPMFLSREIEMILQGG